MARVPLPTPEELPAEYRYLLEDNAVGERAIFRAMANNPPVFRSSMRFASRLWAACGLSPRERELVILAVARRADSAYEWHQHVALAREAGVRTDEIRAIADRSWDDFDADERALLRYAEAVVDRAVTDEVHDALRERRDDAAVVGVAMLASNYLATARWIDAAAVEPEEPFVGWRPDPDA